ncbi:MAG: DNA polymerase III subunit delta' [Legionella longbeachae]|nr:DNA polymerase III subunit delta' [Legionella longbeachae]
MSHNNYSSDTSLSLSSEDEVQEKKYQTQWDFMQMAWVNGRIPQAMLFVGSLDRALIDFINRLNRLIFCKKQLPNPCLECIDCQMLVRGEHPDVQWVKPEKKGGPIKIDQIRELQNYSYLTPQRAKYRLIMIEAADRMNIAAANSLLKILEEPAPHTLFLLIAQQLSTVLPTILSRCQVIRFESYSNILDINFLKLAEHYPQESEQAMIIKQAELILDGLIAVIKKKEHPCVVAAHWNQFELGILLWFLYLVFSQIQKMQIQACEPIGPAIHQLIDLASLLNPIMIFDQIDKINTLQRKLNHNMNVNQILVLEDLLLSINDNESI